MPQVEKYGAPRLGVVTLNVGFMERLQCIVVWIYVYVNVEQLGWIGLEKSSDLKNTNGVALLGYRKPMVAWIRSQPF